MRKREEKQTRQKREEKIRELRGVSDFGFSQLMSIFVQDYHTI